MKKSIIFFLSLFSLFFIACSDSSSDDDSTDEQGGGNPIGDNPANFLGTGDSANDILSNSNFDALRVEIAFVEGFRPTQEAMDGFEEFYQGDVTIIR